MKHLNRRDFIRKTAGTAIGLSAGFHLAGAAGSRAAGYLASGHLSNRARTAGSKPVVSIARIPSGNVAYGVEKALDLLGGVETVARGKERIMLKPNLVGERRVFTTKPAVVRALAELMKKAGKEVCIAEGSAAAGGFNVKNGITYRTRKKEILDGMQQYVFDQLGYTELARSLGVPLVNLHSGRLTEVALAHGLVHDRISLHHSVAGTDLLCSVPMMKTHTLATVTLGMKNLIGLYPGTVYCSVRSCLHDDAAAHGSPGVAYEVIDMVNAARPGLTVIDASTAMEGDGPTDGQLVEMGLIIAGTDPVATDMVAARVMGFSPEEVPLLKTASELGMGPAGLDGIEVRGEQVGTVARPFVRPNVYRWKDIRDYWANEEI